MPDDRSNLPVKSAPLDRTAIERVLARAAELQVASSGADSSELLTESQLIEIGKEAGISQMTLTQALAEERSRIAVQEEQGFLASITGPAVATATRTVRGSPGDVLERGGARGRALVLHGTEHIRIERSTAPASAGADLPRERAGHGAADR